MVKPGDTLWSISVARYGGDPRGGVWKIETERAAERRHPQRPAARPAVGLARNGEALDVIPLARELSVLP